jgi:LysR family transcriptional regulator of abg operon
VRGSACGRRRHAAWLGEPKMLNRKLKAFLTIAERGSIRAAARELSLTKPALTKAIKELEAELSAPLLVRSPHGVQLTEYGTALLHRTRIADSELRRAANELAQMLGAKGGDVAVGLSPVASSMAPDALNRFWKSNASTKVRLVDGLFSGLIKEVQSGNLDFSIGPLPPNSRAAIRSEVLFEHRLAPIARSDHPLARSQRLSDLKAGKWMITSSELEFRKSVEQEFRRKNAAPPEVVTVCESYAALLELLLATDLIALIPRTVLNSALVKTSLVEIPILENLPSTTIALVRNAKMPLTPAAALLAEEFRRAARRYRQKR